MPQSNSIQAFTRAADKQVSASYSHLSCALTMNTFSAQGSGRVAATLPPAALASGMSALAQLQRFHDVAGADGGRREAVHAGINTMQDLLDSFARQLFGNAAGQMAVGFDAAGVAAACGYAGLLHDKRGHDKLGKGAFIGKGVITTADGHYLTFAAELHGQPPLAAGARPAATAYSMGPALPSDGRRKSLTLAFPGSLDELLGALVENELARLFAAPSAPGDEAALPAATVTLHLMDLAQTAQALARQVAALYRQSANCAGCA